ncbi:Cation/H(+) antiporter 15 [Morella rubra]|uniref:Cation/H(+) antiporter 15 n=1 Tax=Morella rubra TaxID=262757 RepID=A0A6A1VXL8_9ROSI|nr:Cation/H(+) antiporter 15 [Morella rubra]
MRLTTSFCSSDHILRAFVNYSKNASGPVTLHPFTMMAPYKSMHENICRIARDKQIPLIVVPYHNNQRAVQGDRVATSVRGLNATIKTLAPCTVGVLVDRGFRNMRPTHFSYHVGVVFIGGRDDREALAYASRMSGHPYVSVTVIRVILRDQNEQGDGDEDEKMERLIDEALFDEFKLKNVCNACVVCREIMVEDSVGVVDAIRCLERNYDLVMVGRRHRKIPLHDEEMPAFTVNEDLGVIGDVLASSDSFGVWVSVLVLHCEGVR